MIEILTKEAKKLKITDFGIVEAKVYSDLCLDLHKKNKSQFVKESPEERSNPFLIMEDAKSLIVCLFSYNTNKKGNISKYAYGKDYHFVIKEKLSALSMILKKKGYKAEAFSDSWCMNERFLAVKAGLGFIGKNHNFISKNYGSFVFVGAIITNCELPASKPLKMSCAGCGECIKNCPGNALACGEFREDKCASYITQKKGELSDEEIKIVKKANYLWGCDICQNVCPHNKNVCQTDIDEFKSDLITNLFVDENLSEKEFKNIYRKRAFSWRGKKVIMRNQEILSNAYKNLDRK